MSELEKLKQRLKTLPKDFSYDEAKSLLQKLGFQESNKGKTSGSRVKFYRKRDDNSLLLHKPHPNKTLAKQAVKDLLKELIASKDVEE